MAGIYHKRGDTFSLTCTWTDSLGTAINLTGYTFKSQVRATSFVDTLTVTVTDAANGVFTIAATATATANWPVTDSLSSKLFCDIQFTNGTTVTSTETFQIVVVEDITQ